MVTSDYDVELHFLSAAGPSLNCLILDDLGIVIKDRPVWKQPTNKFQNTANFDSSYDRLCSQFNAIAINGRVKYSQYNAIVLVGLRIGEWTRFTIRKEDYSQSFLGELFVEYIKETTLYLWVNTLRKVVVSSKVYVMLPPLINELAYKTTQDKVAGNIPEKSDKSFFDTYGFINLGLFSMGATYIPLPPELFSDSFNTMKSDFKSKTCSDMAHLNNQGGEIWLKSLLETLYR
jgi:hypothetical protein